MKLIILIFLLFSTNSFCQTFHGIVAGMDTSALAKGVKSKIEIISYVDSSGVFDTIRTKKYYYEPNGYIKNYEEFDPKNYDFYRLEFEYNKKGYLINHSESGGGAIFGPAPIDSSIITTSKFYNANILKKEIIYRTSWSEFEDWTDTTEIIYDDFGKIKEEYTHPNSRVNYYYLENGLLWKVEKSYTFRIFYREEIFYEYYK